MPSGVYVKKERQVQCEKCEQIFYSNANYVKYCEDCRKEQRKIYKQRWRDDNQAHGKAYQQRPEVKKRLKKALKIYNEKYPEKKKANQKKYRDSHQEEIKAEQKLYNQHPEVKEKARIRSSNYRKKNHDACIESTKKWRLNNKQARKEYAQKYYQENKKAIRVKKRPYFREYIKERTKTDPQFHLNKVIHTAIYQSLKGKKVGRHWEDLVGYTLQDLMQHLENQFENWMNWENYGLWHVDHIKPKSLFSYILPEDPEFKECWALDNLQPLERMENIYKSNFYEELI